MQSSYFKQLQCTVPSSKIGYLKFLLEGYDGMTTLSTIDNREGTILIRYAICFEQQLLAILEAFRTDSQDHTSH